MRVLKDRIHMSEFKNFSVVSSRASNNNIMVFLTKASCVKFAKDMFSMKTLKKRLPILRWLPTYNYVLLIQDIIAGVTVGLTAIPQGIAYAVVAGLSPEYGLYAGLTGGFMYLFVGSCKDITIGPTAIMSAVVAKYVANYSSEFAVLAAFLTGVVIIIMGMLNLGFLVEFISIPVISGFTSAAALQIASAQLKSLFGLDGSAGHYFSESIINFFKNITTFVYWDSSLGLITILILVLLKRLGEGCNRTDPLAKQIRWFISLAKNAVVVIFGMAVAYIIKVSTGTEPIKLIGEIGSGFPKIEPPPFSAVVGNQTYTFSDMMKVLGPESLILPMVSILELVAIAKAFAAGGQIDATQEMIALGLCNMVGSFVKSMPVSGSFTRTALNNASGVQTPLGGIFTATLLILALSLLTKTFYYIPKPSLAGLIITAMFYMIDFKIVIRLWKTSKKEFFVYIATWLASLLYGLEYGILTGILADALILLFATARPACEMTTIAGDKKTMVVISLPENLSYCAAEHVRRKILKATLESHRVTSLQIVVNGTNLRIMDSTVATNLMSIIKDLDKDFNIVFLNFNSNLQKMCNNVNDKYSHIFVTDVNVDGIFKVKQSPA
ncbi:sodium-independent sulfate anion transporter-like [Danaus plexippus]|uniref:sodium-independent sulfate anion transporter-like n=1 Tax=Danaus plexippus TaxID=13037 RepID=UPI002AB039C0|nr:sodium-independent sulfate anion transporter-like [Danaus plexippus]